MPDRWRIARLLHWSVSGANILISREKLAHQHVALAGCSHAHWMDRQTTPQAHPRSSLFTLRLWMEERSAGESEVRMQVRHVLSGETRYLRHWSDLVIFLLTRVEQSKDE